MGVEFDGENSQQQMAYYQAQHSLSSGSSDSAVIRWFVRVGIVKGEAQAKRLVIVLVALTCFAAVVVAYYSFGIKKVESPHNFQEIIKVEHLIVH